MTQNGAIMTTTYNAEQVTDMLLAIADANPDRKNPTNGNGECLYFAATPDGAARCVVGQLAADKGWQLPAPGVVEGAGFIAGEFGWPVDWAGRERLTALQNIFDNAATSADHDGKGPRTWAEAARIVRRTYRAGV